MRRWLALLPLLAGAGCAHYVEHTADVRAAYTAYDEPRALALLESRHRTADDAGIDRLLVLLDYGTVLHAAGRWAESRDVLAKADELAQQLAFTSVTEETGALLGNETVRVYRGEDFEKLMISVLQALNYAALGDDEGALVEVRRCNERLEKMRESGKPYEQLAIARYLGGLLYEDQHAWDSAAIDCAKAADVEPGLAADALRLKRLTGREAGPVLARQADEGEVAVVLEVGQAPRKESSNARAGPGAIIAVPVYRARTVALPLGQVRVGDLGVTAVRVTSIDAVAKLHLEDRIGKLLLKSAASLGLKAAGAAVVGGLAKSEEAGLLAFALLSLTQEADTRSWLSLPAEFQVARVPVKAGQVTVRVTAQGRTTEHEVEVAPGRVKVLVVRRY